MLSVPWTNTIYLHLGKRRVSRCTARFAAGSALFLRHTSRLKEPTHSLTRHHQYDRLVMAKGELSRHSSRQSLLQTDDATSLTSFPDPSVSALPQETQTSSQPLTALLDQNGPSIFDENQSIDASDPQSLSAASPVTLQHVIDHHGAIELVRRLSTALAQRDAHITALRRLAEDYKIPGDLIAAASTRAKQTEARRLSLAQASETLQESSGTQSDSGVRWSQSGRFKL